MNSIKTAFFVILYMGVVLSVQAQDQEYNLDETYSISENGTIHLNSNDAEVTITGSDRSDVHVVVYHRVDTEGLSVDTSGEFDMNVESRGGDLYLREDDDLSHIVIAGSVNEEYRITIEAPRSVALNIEGDDDTYDISNISSKVKLNADDAEADLNGLQGNDFEFEMDDGSINMDQGRGRLKLDMDDGEYYVRRGNFSEIETEVDDAELEFTTSLADDGLYRFEMDDGDLELNISGGGGEFDIRHDDPDISVDDNFEEESSDEDRSVYRLPGGNASIEITTDDGDVALRVI